jgi:hypothetical protein
MARYDLLEVECEIVAGDIFSDRPPAPNDGGEQTEGADLWKQSRGTPEPLVRMRQHSGTRPRNAHVAADCRLRGQNSSAAAAAAVAAAAAAAGKASAEACSIRRDYLVTY